MNEPNNQITPGCLVEFFQNNQPVLGCVLEGENNKLRILNIRNKSIKISTSRLLPWTGPLLTSNCSHQDLLKYLEIHNDKRIKLQNEIDPLEIWELVQNEIDEATVQWLAGLIWNEPEPDQLAAMGRTLLQYKTHFRFQSKTFKIYDPETVQAKLKEQEIKRQKEEFIAYGNNFLKALWKRRHSEDKVSLPEIPHQVEAKLKEILLQMVSDPQDEKSQHKQWKELCKEIPEHPHLPLILAQEWGLLSNHYNYLLDQANYTWGDSWSSSHEQQIQNQKKKFFELQETIEPLSLTSIDSASTQDIDDAFSIKRIENSGYKLKLALACPVLGWEFDSELDRAVAHRSSSIYLPEGATHMLPEKLGTELFSLHALQSKPILLLDIDLDFAGNLNYTDLCLTWSQVQQNLTYAQVEQTLNQQGQSSDLYPALELACKLREKRIENGAVILEQNEPILRLQTNEHDVNVLLEDPPAYPLAHKIVSEFMILANFAAYKWAKENSLPLLHRTQDILLSEDSAGIWQDPVHIYRLMREMSSTRLELEPKPHASLGVKGYSPITSPLRRYTDFLNLAQLVHYIQKKEPRWSKEELEYMLPYLSSRIEAVSKIQRYRLRYWKLLYFKKRCKHRTWPGVVVSTEGPLITFSLPREQIFIRAPKHLFKDKVTLGQRFQLQLGKIDPLSNEIKILTVKEE